jgi:hypothetical protein
VQKNNALTRLFGASAAQIPAEPCIVDGSSDGTDIPDIGGIEIISDDGVGAPCATLQPPQVDPLAVTGPVL